MEITRNGNARFKPMRNQTQNRSFNSPVLQKHSDRRSKRMCKTIVMAFKIAFEVLYLVLLLTAICKYFTSIIPTVRELNGIKYLIPSDPKLLNPGRS